METTPIFYDKYRHVYFKDCLRCNLPKIENKYPSQIKRTKYCSHSCQQVGNKHRVGKTPVNAWKKGDNLGELNYQWKNKGIDYTTLHQWVARKSGTPKQCENCGISTGKFEWANISGEYLRDLSDWVRLCTMCHRLIDNNEKRLNRSGGTPGRKWKPKAI